MRLRWRRTAEQDAAIAEAKARHLAARDEVALSRARRESVRREVIEPLRRAGSGNQFADLIRASLLEGHGRR